MQLPAFDRDVFLRVVGGGRPGGEVLGNGFLHVGRVVLRQRTLFPGVRVGVAWKRTLGSIDYVYKIEKVKIVAESRTPQGFLEFWIRVFVSELDIWAWMETREDCEVCLRYDSNNYYIEYDNRNLIE